MSTNFSYQNNTEWLSYDTDRDPLVLFIFIYMEVFRRCTGVIDCMCVYVYIDRRPIQYKNRLIELIDRFFVRFNNRSCKNNWNE